MEYCCHPVGRTAWTPWTPKYVEAVTGEQDHVAFLKFIPSAKNLGRVSVTSTSRSRSEIKFSENLMNAVTQEEYHLGFSN